MEQVAQYLQQQAWRKALVRLWVLAGNPVTLRKWERVSGGADKRAETADEFGAMIRSEQPIGLDAICASPLGLVIALDEEIAASRATTIGHRVATQAGAPAPFHEDGKDYCLLPVELKARGQAALARQNGNRAAYFKYHAVLPLKTAHGLTVQVHATMSKVHEVFEDLADSETPALKVWVGHFNDGADVQWTRSNGAHGDWLATRVAPGPAREASLGQMLDRARAEGAHVVVLPEFTVDCDLRKRLKILLRNAGGKGPVLVVAGSFHEAQGGRRYNTAPLLSANGSELFKHRKLRLFGDSSGAAEDVSVGATVHVLVSPVGCFSVLICKDFMDAHASVASLLQEVPVDWVLVPSYGDKSTTRAHRAKATQLAKVAPGASSIVASTRNTALEPGGAQQIGFAHPAGADEPLESDIEGKLLELPFGRLAPPEPRLTRVE